MTETLPATVTGGEVVMATPMLRYVNEAEKSDKWWRAQIERKFSGDSIVVVRFGCVATKSQTRLKQFAFEHEANFYVDRKLHEKLDKGYVAMNQDEQIMWPVVKKSLAPVGSDFDDWNPTLPQKKQTPQVKAPPKPEPTGRRIILD